MSGRALERAYLELDDPDRATELVGGDGEHLVPLPHLFLRLLCLSRALLEPLPLGHVADCGDRQDFGPYLDRRKADLDGELVASFASA